MIRWLWKQIVRVCALGDELQSPEARARQADYYWRKREQMTRYRGDR